MAKRMLIALAGIVLLCVLSPGNAAFAQTDGSTQAAEKAAQALEKAKGTPESPKAAEPPAPAAEASAETPKAEASDAEMEAFLSEEPEKKEESGEKKAEESGGMPAGFSTISVMNRITFGMIGPKKIANFGVQAELASKKFGINARWAALQTIPNNIGFSFDFGFVFHYYPFGDAPSGLYVGPGLQIIHIFKNPDPLREHLVPKEMLPYNVLVFNRSGYGHAVDLITPVVEVGYRHKWAMNPKAKNPAYFLLGGELTLGAAVSDQIAYWGTGFYWTVCPYLGFAW